MQAEKQGTCQSRKPGKTQLAEQVEDQQGRQAVDGQVEGQVPARRIAAQGVVKGIGDDDQGPVHGVGGIFGEGAGVGEKGGQGLQAADMRVF